MLTLTQEDLSRKSPKSHKSTRVKETLDAIYATEDSHLDPALMALQALSLPKEDW